jgi:hypothetical protein
MAEIEINRMRKRQLDNFETPVDFYERHNNQDLEE